MGKKQRKSKQSRIAETALRERLHKAVDAADTLTLRAMSKSLEMADVLGDDEDGNYCCMLRILEAKLRGMRKYFESRDFVVDEYIYAEQIGRVLKMLEIVNDVGGVEFGKEGEVRVNYQNAGRFFNSRCMSLMFDKDKESGRLVPRKLRHAPLAVNGQPLESADEEFYIKSIVREEKAWSLLWKMMSLYCRNWWE